MAPKPKRDTDDEQFKQTHKEVEKELKRVEDETLKSHRNVNNALDSALKQLNDVVNDAKYGRKKR